MTAARQARPRRRGRFWPVVLLLIVMVVGFHPLVAWLVERAILRAVSGELAAPPRITSIDVDLSQRRVRLDGVSLDAPGRPGAVQIARVDAALHTQSLWSQSIHVPQMVAYGIAVQLPAAAETLRSGSATVPGGRYWSQIEIAHATVQGGSVVYAWGGSAPAAGNRLDIERVDLDNVSLVLSDQRPAHGPDVVVDSCMIAHTTAAFTDEGISPPLAQRIDLAALDVDRIHYPASDPEVLWPIKAGGEITVATETGGFYLSGGYNRMRLHSNFTLQIDLRKLPLTPYEPYLTRPLQYGYLSLTLHAQCRHDQVQATADGAFTRLWFKPLGTSTEVFGLPEKAVLDLLLRQGNKLEFAGVRIRGDLSNPHIAWLTSLPVGLEYVLERQLRLALQAPDVPGMLALEAVRKGASRQQVRAALHKQATDGPQVQPAGGPQKEESQ